MLKIVNDLFDLIFPPRPHEVLLRSTSPTFIQGLLKPRQFARMTYLLSYQHNVVTALITENKFHHNEKAAQLLAGVLEDWLVTLPADSILVPIPLSSERKNSRGYNQVEEILRHVSSTWKSQTITNLLVRTRHTEAQTSLGRNERLTNINGAFAINHTYLETVTASTIVIIDDVVTTGATLKAAEAKLRPLLPHTRIILLGLAH